MYTAIDTETTLAGNREPIPRLACVTFANELGVEILHASDPRLFAYVAGALAGGAIFANAPFDLFVLWRHLGPAIWPHIRAALEAGRIADVLTREKYLDIAAGQHRKLGPYNLGAVAQRRAGLVVNKADPWRRRYGALVDVPIAQWPDGALTYAQWDAWSTWRVWQEQERARHAVVHNVVRDLLVDAPACARAHVALYAMTLRGIETDPVRVAALDLLLTRRIRGLEARVLAAGLARRKHTTARCSPGHKVCQCPPKRYKVAAQAALEAWCRAIGREPERSDKGSISLSKKALQHAQVPRGTWDDATLVDIVTKAPAHPIECYRELGGTRAGYSKNIPILKHPRIRTRYDELVATGRTSASGFKAIKVEDADDDDEDEGLEDFDCELEPGDEWVGTNTQNFPRDGGWRECLVPPAGHFLGGTDYGALELVTFSQVAIDWTGGSALAETLRAGKDPHSAFAAEHLAHVPYDQFSKKDPTRQLAKAWNFGKLGAMGEERFLAWALVTYKLTITPEEHRRIDQVWRAAHPEVLRYWAKIKREFATAMGPRGPEYTIVLPRSGRVRGGCGFPDASNTPFQGEGATVAKRAAWLLFLAGLDPASPLYGCYQLLFEHDAFATAIPIDPAHVPWDKGVARAADAACRCRSCDALREQDRLMIAASNEICPDVPMTVESALHERYTK